MWGACGQSEEKAKHVEAKISNFIPGTLDSELCAGLLAT